MQKSQVKISGRYLWYAQTFPDRFVPVTVVHGPNGDGDFACLDDNDKYVVCNAEDMVANETGRPES